MENTSDRLAWINRSQLFDTLEVSIGFEEAEGCAGVWVGLSGKSKRSPSATVQYDSTALKYKGEACHVTESHQASLL